MASNISKNDARLKRKIRIRKKIKGSSDKPRLCVYRSLSNIYVQIIDDTTGTTLVSASTIDKEIKALPDSGNKKAEAQLVGKIVGQRALAKGINKVVFDRNGYIYHGRIKAVSDGAREAGLDF
ncbi:50S ribosomal protein L18 [Desulforegula conservatrix]|uniref:50S ribosomal protein L18 n=1 Tax=Desulforegula conservatrix TaxID=153026 RepID=UPI0003F7410A|nr:50S ribosomal protein L18 [Desulforegula conservatrix]